MSDKFRPFGEMAGQHAPFPPENQRKKIRPAVFFLCVIFSAGFVFVCGLGLGFLLSHEEEGLEEMNQTTKEIGEDALPDWIRAELIPVDGASRRGEKLEEVSALAVHYVGNPNTGAMATRNYFASPDSDTSSHFIVGLEGEVIQCIPLDEKSSATNHRNRDTVSIEVCHPDETGEFSPVTRAALVRLLAYLCQKFGLDEEEIIRHYDVTGKLCPLYYVENEKAWQELKNDVKNERNRQGGNPIQ